MQTDAPTRTLAAASSMAGAQLHYNDEVKGKTMARACPGAAISSSAAGPIEDFFKVWPGRKDNPFTAVLDNTQKLRPASTTLHEPLPNLFHRDAADAVAKLKSGDGGDVAVVGRGVLCIK